MEEKKKYYSLNEIKKRKATYNIIIGQRSNGKTYACLLDGLKDYVKNKNQLGLIRRWKEDFVGKRGQAMFSALVDNGEVERLTDGEYTTIVYRSSKWYLGKYVEDQLVICEDPFCYGFALSEMEHDKSTSYNRITMVVFDEFITRFGYLKDEFVTFCNVISTIVRHRTNVTIYMLGNTVNRFCPYFQEMGLKHIKEQKQGEIDLYTYGESELKVAVEYCKPTSKANSKSNFYFAFDNPKLKMITGGAWEIDIYPHLPIKYLEKNIIFQYFIKFDGYILHCEIIEKDGCCFTYIHRKTTDIQDEINDIIYSTETKATPNYRRNLLKPIDKLDKRIAAFYGSYKVFYQDNEVGEVMRNYLLWCGARS